MTHEKRSVHRAKFHKKVMGTTFGIYTWQRFPIPERGYGKCGVIVRIGPLGHIQAVRYRRPSRYGRRPMNTLQLSVWGVRGRRHKRSVSVTVVA